MFQMVKILHSELLRRNFIHSFYRICYKSFSIDFLLYVSCLTEDIRHRKGNHNENIDYIMGSTGSVSILKRWFHLIVDVTSIKEDQAYWVKLNLRNDILG